LVDHYQQLYGERDFGSEGYRKHLRALMTKFKKKYGIGAPGPRGPIREFAAPQLAQQLQLF
jgi:hypothetical protein